MDPAASLEPEIPALRRYAFALLRDRTEADDLVQETLLRALGRLHQRQGAMRPWLFAIMHNLHVNDARRARRRATVTLDDPGADAPVPGAQLSSAEMADAWRGLAQLPQEQRQVLLLVAVEGFDYAEAAQILGLPLGTVMSRLSRARDRLRDFVNGRAPPVLRRVK
jgi:RNA polymerase sigma-70 factor, ECF subfamily